MSKIYLGTILLAVCSATAWGIVDIDGRTLNQWSPTNQDNDTAVRYRPTNAADDGATLIVQDMHLHDVTNQKAIYASASFTNPNGDVWTYGQMIFRNLEINNVYRDSIGDQYGLHQDFLYIQGADPGYHQKPNVLVENVYMHDGDAQPLFVKGDGVFGDVTLRNIHTSNVGTANKVHLTQLGTSLDTLTIEDCPGEHFSFGPTIGEGTIGRIIVRNSPGIVISNYLDAPIYYDPNPGDAMPFGATFADASVPEPASLSLIGLAAFGLLRRSRKS